MAPLPKKQAGEFCLACVGHVGGTIVETQGRYRVRKSSGLDASTAAAVEAAVAPGAAYRVARDAVSVALCDVEYYKTAANAVKRAIADEANCVLDDYAQRVADADRAVDGLDFSFEGATRLRHLLSDATPTLEAVRDCVEALTSDDAPRGGRLVDFCRDRAQRAGAPQVAYALRRLTAAAEKAVLRACCAWCVRGDLCRDFFVRAARRAVSEPWPPLRAENAPVQGAQPSLGRFELDANSVPRSLASKHLAERILFLGGATRVLRVAAKRRKDAAAREARRRRFLQRAVAEIEAEPRFGGLVKDADEPIQAEASEDATPATRAWRDVVALAAPPIESDGACGAEARDARLREALERLVDAHARVAAERLKRVLVEDGSLAAAIGTLGGVCLLRCGPLWSRALDLARPTLARAPDPKRGALCIQRCLEHAARDLLPGDVEDEEERLWGWRAFERAGGVKGAGRADAEAFFEALGARRTKPRTLDVRDRVGHRAALDAVVASKRGDARDPPTTALVVADPEPFVWSSQEADLRARFGLRGDAARAEGLIVLGGDSAPKESDDEQTPRFPRSEVSTVPALEALEPRRLAQRAWRLEAVAVGRGGDACVRLALRRPGMAARRRRPAVAAALAGGLLEVSLDGSVVATRPAVLRKARLALRSARGVDGRWELDVFAVDAATDAVKATVKVVVDVEGVLGTSCAVIALELVGERPVDVQRFALDFDVADEEETSAAAVVLGSSSLSRRAARADAEASRAADAWSRALRCDVAPRWPVGDLLPGSSAGEDYQAAFSRIFAARKALADLDACWPALSSAGREFCASRRRRDERDGFAALMRLQHLHFRCSALCRCIVAVLQRDGVEPLWRRLCERVEAPGDYDALRDAHRAFLLDLRDALRLDEEDVGAALEAVFRDAARLARLVDSYASSADDLPASTLDALRRDFDVHAAELVALPALAETALVGCLDG